MQNTDRDTINRANAQNSTGPRTEAGKKKSSLNAMRHGLTGQTVLMPSDDIDAYKAYCKRTFDELKPIGLFEEQAVQTIADTHWRLNRGRAYESTLFSLQTDAVEINDRLDAALKTTKSLTNLSNYERRLTHTLEQAKKELADLQKIRLDHAESELQTAINLRRYHIINNLQWHPKDHGFVFTVAELSGHLRRNSSRDKANEYARWNPLASAKTLTEEQLEPSNQT